MRDASIENLKLSVTNIRSTLLNSNNQLRRVKIRKKSLIARFEKQKNFRKEESRLESPLGKIGSGISRVAGKITAPAKSFFDRMMDFIKLIGFGILLKNLPRIISAIQNFFSSDFGKGLLKVMKFAGNMLLKVIDLTVTYGPVVINQLKNLMGLIGNQVDEINKIDFSNILNNLNPWENYFDGIIKWFSGLSTQSLNSKVTPGSKGIPPTTKQPQKKSRGGTVRGDSTVEERRNPVYQPRKSGPLKAAQRNADNGFLSFKEGVDNIQDAAMKDERNMMALADMVKTFKSYSLLFDDKKSSESTPESQPRSQSRSQSRSQPGPPTGTQAFNQTMNSGIVGRVGSTGASTAPHIHIETGDGYTGKGEKIPATVLNNIIVGGKPLNSYIKTSPIGPRIHPKTGKPGYHYGMDFDAPDGAAITLKGGLKLIDYDTDSDPDGYGNNIKIEDANGNVYILGHLSSGPESGPSGGPLNMVSSLRSRNLKMNMSEEDQQSVFMLAIQPQEVMVPFPMPIPIKSGNPNVASSTPKSSALWRV